MVPLPHCCCAWTGGVTLNLFKTEESACRIP
jgi:hypothetical protein